MVNHDKRKILVSWLGDSDIRHLNDSLPNMKKMGPLHSILSAPGIAPFDEIWLFKTLHGTPAGLGEDARPIALKRLEDYCRRQKIKLVPITAPINFEVANMDSIYEFMFEELLRLRDTCKRNKTLFFYNLTSGTPAMYAIQLYLSGNKGFEGTPLYTMPPGLIPPGKSNVFEAHLPSRLAGIEADGHETLFVASNSKIYDQVRSKVAATNASILIQGETGTGKTALARFIHQCDPVRGRKKMEEINCAALGTDANSRISELFGHEKGSFTGAINKRKGAFERADGGILFLDEIGEIPLEHQGMLLRAIEEGLVTPLGSEQEVRVDVRLIAATNINLAKAVNEGRFRADLYYRLAQYAPVLKPVRHYARAEKEQLLLGLLENINLKNLPREPRSLAPEAKNILLAFPWYGNIREMKFRLESICLLSETVVTADDVLEQLPKDAAFPVNMAQNDCAAASGGLPPANPCAAGAIPANLKSWLDEWEKYWIRNALAHYPNLNDAAKKLGLPKSTLVSKKTKFGLGQIGES